MQTNYVIGYRGTGAYLYSYDHNTGHAIYTQEIMEARRFDSATEAALVVFGLLTEHERHDILPL